MLALWKQPDPESRFSTSEVQIVARVFPGPRGREAGGRWRHLTGRARDMTVELLAREADSGRGSAHWVAHYTFTQTGRRVVNDVHANSRFHDGLITEHRADFSFHSLGESGHWALPACSLAGRRCCARRFGAKHAQASTSSWRLPERTRATS